MKMFLSGMKWERASAILAATFCLIAILGLIRTFLVIDLAADSVIYNNEVQKVREQEAENEDVKSKIDENKSLQRIYDKAIQMGFVTPGPNYYVVVKVYGGR